SFSFAVGPERTRPAPSADHRENVVLAHDQILFPVDLEGLAAVRPEDHTVLLFDLHGSTIAVLEQAPAPDRHDDAFLRLLLRGVRQHDATGGLLFRFDLFDDDPVVEGTNVELRHQRFSPVLPGPGAPADVVDRDARPRIGSEHLDRIRTTFDSDPARPGPFAIDPRMRIR